MPAPALPTGPEIHLSAGQVRAAVAAPARRAAAEAVVAAVPRRGGELQPFLALLRQTHGALIAAVSIITPDRQTYLAIDGFHTEYTEVGDELSFCAHVVAGARPLAVPDALHDRRFASNPLVADRTIASYVGVPVRDDDGHVLGSLCLFSAEPGGFDASSIPALAQQARTVRLLLRADRPTTRPARVEAHRGVTPWWRAALGTVGDLLARRRLCTPRQLRVHTTPVRPSGRRWRKRLVAVGYAMLQTLFVAFMVAIVVAAWVNQTKGPPGRTTEVVPSTPERPGSTELASQVAAPVGRSAPGLMPPAAQPADPARVPHIGVRLPEVDLQLPDITVGVPDTGVILSWGAGLLGKSLATSGGEMDGFFPGKTGGTSSAGLGAAVIGFVTLAAVAGTVARRRLDPRADRAINPRGLDSVDRTGHGHDDVSGDALRTDAPVAPEVAALNAWPVGDPFAVAAVPEVPPHNAWPVGDPFAVAAVPEVAPHNAWPVGDPFAVAAVPEVAPHNAWPVGDPFAVAAVPEVAPHNAWPVHTPKASPLEQQPFAAPDTPVRQASPSGTHPLSPGPPESTSLQDAETPTVAYVDARFPSVPVETTHIVRRRRSGRIHR